MLTFLIGTVTGAIISFVVFGLCYMASQPDGKDKEKPAQIQNTKKKDKGV